MYTCMLTSAQRVSYVIANAQSRKIKMSALAIRLLNITGSGKISLTHALYKPHFTHLKPTSSSIVYSARLASLAETRGEAPESSRQPIERTLGDQNPHLKHAASSAGGDTGRDSGKGNADPVKPELPSKKLVEKEEREGMRSRSKGGPGKAKRNTGTTGKPARGIHTSGWQLADQNTVPNSKHSAESYFKDVDTSPPESTKTHVVAGSADANTHRPNEQYADPKKEYATMSKDEPYEPPVEECSIYPGEEKKGQKKEKLRYGGTNRDAERDRSISGQGPENVETGTAGGMQPEGKH